MHIMNMFCPIKANKNRKSHPPPTIRNSDNIVQNNNNSTNNNLNHNNNNSNNNNNNSNNNNINNNSNNNNNNVENQHATINVRYVTSEYRAQELDELSVKPGDAVVCEFTDSNSSGNWSHVLNVRTIQRGFVPSEILSTDPQCKKKLPRSNPIDQHIHKTSHHVGGDQPSSNGDNIRYLQQPTRELRPSFEIPHSVQGSSGNQTFQKYPDFRHLTSPPAYYNLAANELSSYEHFELKCTPFRRENFGLYMVTNNFVAREENDLSVRPGDSVTVLNKDDEDWYWVRRECDLAEGFVPSRFICDYELVKSILNKGNSTVTMKSSNNNDSHTYMNHRPDKNSLVTDQQSSVFQVHG